MMRRAGFLLVAILAACQRPVPESAPVVAAEPEAMLFSYFVRNGDDGLHLAWSPDGITWLPLNGGRPLVRPTVVGNGVGWQAWDTKAALMRDPSILRGPDGVFHMVWTIAWTDKGIGIAHSRDLIEWSEQQRIPVMDHEPDALNAWAPELFYDSASRQYLIVWATGIPGRFPETESMAQRTSKGRADPRLYYVTTKDFVTYSPTRLFYDGGFAVIDGAMARVGNRYVLVMKDERFYPETRNLRVAFAPTAEGPWSAASPSFTDLHTEGPSIMHAGDWWYVYYDEYTRGHYGAVRTKDFVTFEPYRDSLHTPRGMRHGSAFLAPASVLAGLRALDSVPR